MAQQRTQLAQGDASEDEEEKPQPQYLIDVEAADASSRSLPVMIASRRCFTCVQADEEPPSPSSDAAQYRKRIVDHCVGTEDYLLPDTPLKEAIFRVMLSRGNKPVTAQEVSQVLSEKWAMTPYPRDVAPGVIQRLMDNSESYCITRLPEPEPEPEPEPQVAPIEDVPPSEVADEVANDASDEESEVDTSR